MPEPDLNQSLSALVHGLAKVGKSLLAASLPKPLLYLDVEQGAKFLPLRRKVINLRDPWPKSDGTWDTALLPVLDWDTARRALDRLQSQPHPFRSVSTDSIAALQKRAINSIVGAQNAPEIQQWGEILRELQNYCEQLRDLTSHPRNPLQAMLMTSPTRLKDGKYGPFLQGQLQDTIPYLFDITGYLYVEPKFDVKTKTTVETRYLRTRRTPTIEAGERVGGRIDPVYELPQVTGKTAEEVMRKNVTFQRLMKAVWDPAVASIAPPAPQAVPEPQPVAAGSSTQQGAN